MNPKFDKDPRDLDNDFESTHKLLVTYNENGGRTLDIATQRLLWEQKVMRVLKEQGKRLDAFDEWKDGKSTVKLAVLAQKEIASTPVVKFYASVRKWTGRGAGHLLAAIATGAVAWYLASHGFKAP